jgi:DNA-binding response OmpR family regulator
MNNLQSHILYIEDHEDTRELVTLVLTESNHRVTLTSTSKDALKRARQERFDLYLLDSWLPDGSGIDLCRQLREFDRRTPIMFLSAAAYETDKQAAMESGAQRYLVKPVDLQVLSDEVTELILAFANKDEQPGGLTRSHSSVRGGAKAVRSGVFI